MPVITKVVAPQLPKPNTALHQTNLTPMSILGSAIDVSTVKASPIKCMIYGKNRVGKTTLACQFHKPLLLVSFEPAFTGGMESVRKVPGVKYLGRPDWIPSSKGALELASELAKGNHPYKTVVLDTGTAVQDMCLCEILDLPEIPVQNDWGTVSSDQYRNRSEKAREVLRPFLKLNMDTIVLLKEKDHNPPKEEKVSPKTGKVMPDMRPKFLRGVQQESFISGDMGGATIEWLQDQMDFVRLFIEEEEEEREVKVGKMTQTMKTSTGNYIRYLRCRYHPNYAAGIRSCSPERVPEVMPNPTAEKILDMLRG